MQRQELDPETAAFVAERRAYHHQEAENGVDDFLDEKHRRNREHVLGPRCRVQRDDDVLCNGEVLRVIGPARDEGWFYGLQQAPWGAIDVPYSGANITDRAPADTGEAALPILVEVVPTQG
jgi:hypothetical protein